MKVRGTISTTGKVAIGTDVTGSTKTLEVNGEITGTKVYNAVYNDIADFLELDEELALIEPGKVYALYQDGKVGPSRGYCEACILGIASDTYGFGIGQKEIGNREIPLAIGGFVLAYCDNKEYAPGTPLTSGANGFLTELRPDDLAKHPDKLVAIFYKKEKLEEWNGVPVKDRIWVKVI